MYALFPFFLVISLSLTHTLQFVHLYLVMKTLKVFVKNWTSIYFLAVTVKQSTLKQKSSLLASYAESLLGHMNTRPSQDGYDILLDGDNTEQNDIPPTLYAQGLWILAFGKSFFERHFAFMME